MPRPTLYERMRSANRLPTAPSPPPPISTPHNPVRSGSLIRPYQPPRNVAQPARVTVKPHPSQTQRTVAIAPPRAAVEVAPPGGWKTNATIPMVRLSERAKSRWDMKAGEFFIHVDDEGVTWCDLALPGKLGEPTHGSIPLIRNASSPVPKPWRADKKPWPTWTWDGNEERPTFKPSIKHGDPTDDYYWHGYATAGVLEGCAEKLK